MNLTIGGKPKFSSISLSDAEKISIIGNLNTMLSAGIPLYEAVESLIADAKGNVHLFLTVMKEDLVQGNHIFTTLSKFPKTFDKVTVNVIKASEEAGTLETALADLADHIKKEMEFNSKIKGAMVYPMLIMVVFLGVLLLILVVVIPKIATVFTNLKVELPLPTRVLIFLSDTLLKNTVPVLVGGFLIVFVFTFMFKRYRGLVLPLFYNLPLISKLIREIDLTRFSRNLYLLLTAGIPITSALELSKDVVIRKDTAEMVEQARTMILSGKKLSEGLSGSKKIIPSIMLKLIEVGEKSGSLPKSMKDISEFLDFQVSETIKNLTVLLEPIMLITVGIFVGAMMLAIIAPIYGLISQVGGGAK